MLTVQYAKNPVYGNEDGNIVVLQVKFEEFNEEMPFGAAPFDTMPYGVDLYNRAIAGEFGPIAPFQPVVVAGDQPTSTGAQTL